MKVGGNESATKYFQSHGGSAALASKDAKVKYTSNAAVKYKDELKRRAAQDAKQLVHFPFFMFDFLAIGMLTMYQFRYPEEVIVTDIPTGTPSDGSSTPAGDGDDDFFSSWDKPTIKRPSNPPSRTGTPPVVNRTGSPFLNASENGSRSKSPLSASEGKPASPAPTAIRPTSATRNTSATSATKKGSVLGAKKVISGDIDFEEAERKAKEEAERIEKLGYDPEAEQAETGAKARTATSASILASPAPICASPAGFGATSKTHERSSSDVERLGMGIGRLGFGQVSKPAAPKKLGFGAVGPKSPVDGRLFLLGIGKISTDTGNRGGTYPDEDTIRHPKGYLL